MDFKQEIFPGKDFSSLLEDIYNKIEGQESLRKWITVSLYEDEINNGNIKNFNFYY